MATYLHACEGESVVKLTNVKIPYFNAPIYLENKTQIGKVEEIFGAINDAVSVARLSTRFLDLFRLSSLLWPLSFLVFVVLGEELLWITSAMRGPLTPRLYLLF